MYELYIVWIFRKWNKIFIFVICYLINFIKKIYIKFSNVFEYIDIMIYICYMIINILLMVIIDINFIVNYFLVFMYEG